MTDREEACLDNAAILLELGNCIRSHCSRIRRSRSSEISAFANHILFSFERSGEALGLSGDVLKIEELSRLLTRGEKLLAELSPRTVESINYKSPLLDDEQVETIEERFLAALERETAERATRVTIPPQRVSSTKDSGVFLRRQRAVASLAEGVRVALKELRQMRGPHGNLDHQAVVVASVCRKVWQEETSKVPPAELHPDRETALSGFVQAIFDILKIRSTPSSAFFRLKKLGGDQALKMSVKVG